MQEKTKFYVRILVGISFVATLFHLLILIRIIPFEITWGGRLKTVEEMYVFETLSILINSFFIFVLLQKGEYIRYFMSKKLVSVVLWFFFVLFALNTVGNVFAKTNFEKLFTILTLLCAILIWFINRTTIKQTN